jgi:hypothetical protein
MKIELVWKAIQFFFLTVIFEITSEGEGIVHFFLVLGDFWGWSVSCNGCIAFISYGFVRCIFICCEETYALRAVALSLFYAKHLFYFIYVLYNI